MNRGKRECRVSASRISPGPGIAPAGQEKETGKRTIIAILWTLFAFLSGRLFPRTSWWTSLLSVISVVSVFLFFGLTDEVHEQGHGTTAFDHSVLHFFHQHWNPWLNVAAHVCAVLGSLEVLGLVVLLGMFLGRQFGALRPAFRVMPVGAASSLVILNIVKFGMHRSRPDLFIPLFHATGYSFPSGHAFLSLVIYGLLGYFLLQLPGNRRVYRLLTGFITVVLIVCIGISRAYAEVHYPTDVLAGWAVGVPCLYVLVLWSKWLTECAEAPPQAASQAVE